MAAATLAALGPAATKAYTQGTHGVKKLLLPDWDKSWDLGDAVYSPVSS